MFSKYKRCLGSQDFPPDSLLQRERQWDHRALSGPGALKTRDHGVRCSALAAMPARRLRQMRDWILELKYLTLSLFYFPLCLPFPSFVGSYLLLSSFSKTVVESSGWGTWEPLGEQMACECGVAGRRYELLVLALPITHPVFRSWGFVFILGI